MQSGFFYLSAIRLYQLFPFRTIGKYLLFCRHMMTWYFTLVLIIIAFLASLSLFFQPKADPYLKFFPFFLLVYALEESVSDYLLLHGKYNTVLFNPFSVLIFCFYFFILRRIVYSPKAKKIILYILCIYPIIALFNIYFIQKDGGLHTVTYSLGCLLIVGCCIYYFLELFQLSHMVNLVRQPAFWICSGLLFYFACSFPLYGLNNLVFKNVSRATILNLMILFNLLDVFLYSSFIIAFLCRIRVRKSML